MAVTASPPIYPRNSAARARLIRSCGLVDAREVTLLSALLVAYFLAYAFTAAQDFTLMNVVGPATLTGILALGAWWRITQDPQSLWTPLFWFRVASGAYYGVGALTPYIANDVTIREIRGLFAFTENEALKVDMINVSCILTVLGTAAFVSNLLAGRRSVVRSNQDRVSVSKYAAMFLIVGGIARYQIVLPVSLGLINVLPGIFIFVAKCYIIGLFLLILVALRGNRTALILSAILVPIDLAIGLLTFSKAEVLLTLVFVYLGVLHQKLSVPRILFGLALVLGVYSQLDPIVHFGRNELYRRHEDLIAPLDERFEILSAYTTSYWDGSEFGERMGALARLCYIGVATMVVAWRDGGQSGDSLSYMSTVLVPRLLWPDKPIVTSIGSDLYTAATGGQGSSIAPGLFSEAYWNFGWLGIPLLMVPLGVILTIFSKYSLNVVHREAWLHFPAVLIGILAGMRVDGMFVSDIVGTCIMALAYALAVFTVEQFMGRPRARMVPP